MTLRLCKSHAALPARARPWFYKALSAWSWALPFSCGGFVAAGRLYTLQPPFHCYEKTSKNTARNLAKRAGYSASGNKIKTCAGFKKGEPEQVCGGENIGSSYVELESARMWGRAAKSAGGMTLDLKVKAALRYAALFSRRLHVTKNGDRAIKILKNI